MIKSKTVLVCGATRGIGLEVVKQLKAAGDNFVIATYRGETCPPELKALRPDSILGNVDVGSDLCTNIIADGLDKVYL